MSDRPRTPKGEVAVSSDHGGQVPVHRRHVPIGRHVVSIGGGGVLHASRCEVVNYKKSPSDSLRQALAEGNVVVVASILSRAKTGTFLEFVPAAGRINVGLACSLGRVFDVIPVLPEVREKLEAEILGRVQVLPTTTGTP